MKFTDLGLAPPLLKAIQEKGYTEPSPIQEKAIPQILKGKDVLASAQTGTGKTAGFTLPLLHILSKQQKSGHRKVRALVLTPTRELAAQIYENVKEYSNFWRRKPKPTNINPTQRYRCIDRNARAFVGFTQSKSTLFTTCRNFGFGRSRPYVGHGIPTRH